MAKAPAALGIPTECFPSGFKPSFPSGWKSRRNNMRGRAGERLS